MKRLYVPLPDESGRRQLMNILLKTSVNRLTQEDVEEVVQHTKGAVMVLMIVVVNSGDVDVLDPS